jgi:hypothetical protein
MALTNRVPVGQITTSLVELLDEKAVCSDPKIFHMEISIKAMIEKVKPQSFSFCATKCPPVLYCDNTEV